MIYTKYWHMTNRELEERVESMRLKGGDPATKQVDSELLEELIQRMIGQRNK